MNLRNTFKWRESIQSICSDSEYWVNEQDIYSDFLLFINKRKQYKIRNYFLEMSRNDFYTEFLNFVRPEDEAYLFSKRYTEKAFLDVIKKSTYKKDWIDFLANRANECPASANKYVEYLDGGDL